MKDGFTVERGADFAAIITPCDNCGSRVADALAYMPSESEASEYAEHFEWGTEADAAPMGIAPVKNEKTPFVLTPNPARNMVTVALEEGAPQGTVLNVLDMAGHEVLNQPVATGA